MDKMEEYEKYEKRISNLTYEIDKLIKEKVLLAEDLIDDIKKNI